MSNTQFKTRATTVNGVEVFKVRTTAGRNSGVVGCETVGFVAKNTDGTFTEVFDMSFEAAEVAR